MTATVHDNTVMAFFYCNLVLQVTLMWVAEFSQHEKDPTAHAASHSA